MEHEISIQQIKEYSPQLLEDINNLLIQLNPEIKPLSEKNLLDILNDSSVYLFAALRNNRVIATTTLVIYKTLCGKRANIEDVVVDKDARGNGLGKKLVGEATKKATEEEVPHINLTSHPDRTAANHLYQSLGFKKRETNVYRLYLQEE